MAPVILALKKSGWADVRVLATAQHRDLLDQVNDFFGIKPDLDLNIMQPNQSLSTLSARLLTDVDKVLMTEHPDAVLVQGDTTTVMTVSLAAFYHKLPVGHVEAGLRTGDIYNPFPEEANRVITSRLAYWHFAPTLRAKQNLAREGVPTERIFITGNTVIDALQEGSRRIAKSIRSTLRGKKVLITSHRRENFGEPLINICAAIRILAQNNKSVEFIYPVHPNPNVRNVVYDALSGIANVTLCQPLDYVTFLREMNSAYIILTDSGGVQEEAPALGKPVLVLRGETERPEAIELGVAKLIGTDADRIISEVQRLLDDDQAYREMAKGVSPYGDGLASSRIEKILADHFSARSPQT